jgi:type II secretory ATPase GspE/PulE/Tfp pilus assembly ATPase PilB-like protein
MTAVTLESTLPVHELFSAEYLEYYRMLPLALEDGRLRVAQAGEPHAEAHEDLCRTFQATVDLVPVDEAQLRDAIRRHFSAQESVVELVRDLDDSAEQAGDDSSTLLADARNLAAQPPVIRFVNLLIRDAHAAGASDLHLEATRQGLRVRARVDGVLQELPSPPLRLHAAVVSRVKLLAELDISERRRPQDGRIRVRLESRELDLRVSTIPTLFGESVALRLLDRGGGRVSLDGLGLSPELLNTFSGLARRSHGILLVTGPTGSGKTTTLYAALGLRDHSAEKVITVEDPVEYHLDGVTQMPVHAGTGVTFASALRHLLRQDPDVLMVGEMRDRETAAVAVQAAMTGHLVLSTLHTNDAVAALTRLADLGVEPYMIAATVEGVLAQRLVRRSCTRCLEPYEPDAAALGWLSDQQAEAQEYARGRGCEHCRHTGYRGRIGVFELLRMTDELREALLKSVNQPEMVARARRAGMLSMREDGWQKVQAGITTAEEVVRVLQG